MKTTSLLFACALFSVQLFSQWQTLETGTNAWLNSVYFTDGSIGWAVGSNGTIIHTDDGGLSWETQTSSVSTFLQCVFFIDNNNGWAVGGSTTESIIIHTSDGGANWTEQTSGAGNDLRCIQFIDNSLGWACGSEGIIVHTSNGGSSWSSQVTPTSNRLYYMTMLDQNTGFAVGENGTVLKTTNGGSSWIDHSLDEPHELRCVFFQSINNGFIVGEDLAGNGVFHWSQNTGTSWVHFDIGSYNEFRSVVFIDGVNGWIAGYDGTLLKTVTGALSWTQESTGISVDLSCVTFPLSGQGYASGDNGTIIGLGVPTGFEDQHIDEFSFSISPNPATCFITITCQQADRKHTLLEICDLNGRKLIQKQIPVGSETMEIDVSYLQSGVYFCRLRINDQIITKKIIKQ